MIIDSHCHLDFPELYDNLPEILKRADDAGVKKILTICTKLKNEPQIRKISSNNPSVYYAVGTHPMSAADEPMATVDQLQAISKNPKMIGIGETGLDYFYTEKTKNTHRQAGSRCCPPRSCQCRFRTSSRSWNPSRSSGMGGKHRHQTASQCQARQGREWLPW